jgi:hypothetical protein
MEVVSSGYDHAQHREHRQDRRDDDEDCAGVHADRDGLRCPGAGVEHEVRPARLRELDRRIPPADRVEPDHGAAALREGRGPGRDAFQGLLNQWANTYAGFFAPVGPYREGLENVTRNVTQMPALMTQVATGRAVNGGLPIEGYDELNVAEISGRLDSLSEEELKRVRDYERRNKNRETLIEQLDRKIRANS